MKFPLTPALSPSEGEREDRRQSAGETCVVEKIVGRTLLFPLPRRGGEGQGEGASLLSHYARVLLLS